MTIEQSRSGDVLTIIHNRPEARGAMDRTSARQMWQAFLDFEASDAKVAVLASAGKDFCAGWDLKLAASLADPQTCQTYFDDHAFPDRGEQVGPGALGPTRLELSKPVIGAVEGAAVAGGMELAMWCDVRVMAETAYMGVFCRRWGISLMDGGSVRLPRLVGEGKALEIAMTGRKVEAEECHRIGLCEKVVAHGQARAAAEAMAHDIARFPQQAVRADRRSIIENRGTSVGAALRNEWENGYRAILEEGTAGAARFRDGAGRHGDFGNI